MSEVWNSWDLKPPPVCTVKTVLHFKEISRLKEVVFDMLKILKNIEYLHKEGGLLSRFLYKNKRPFRHDKGLQNLVKINQCLKRYLKLDLCEVANTFKQSLPGKLQQGATHAYLPTRQMLKWLLLRIQAFSQIFLRLTILAKEAGGYFFRKLHLGWALTPSLLSYGTTARILAISKYLIAKSIEWHDSLYKYLPYLQQTAEFLPDYKLPSDLKKWLGDVDLRPFKKKTSLDEVLELIDLTGEHPEDEDDDDDDIRIVSLKTLYATEGSSDVEEIQDEHQEKGIKRSAAVAAFEDFGVPVDEVPRKKKKKKGGKGR